MLTLQGRNVEQNIYIAGQKLNDELGALESKPFFTVTVILLPPYR